MFQIKDQISDVMGIKGVNTEPAYGMNGCYWKTNNCSHLCFHKPHKGSICACPTRMELRSDRKTCKCKYHIIGPTEPARLIHRSFSFSLFYPMFSRPQVPLNIGKFWNNTVRAWDLRFCQQVRGWIGHELRPLLYGLSVVFCEKALPEIFVGPALPTISFLDLPTDRAMSLRPNFCWVCFDWVWLGVFIGAYI